VVQGRTDMPTSLVPGGPTEDAIHKHVMLTDTFIMAPSEYAKAKAWMQEHGSKHPTGGGTIAGQYWVRFARNSIGDVTTVGCDVCGEHLDVTDIDLW
jgi:hypothetical protein